MGGEGGGERKEFGGLAMKCCSTYRSVAQSQLVLSARRADEIAIERSTGQVKLG